MQPDFWHERWRTGQIGFHQATVSGGLEKHWPLIDAAGGGRVFVPLCGKSLDLEWLRERGCSVAGVDLSAIALESFCMEHGIPARRRTEDGFDVYEAARLQLYRGDFFALQPQLLGACSAVYDRASLISWSPEIRARYVEKMTMLTAPGTQTLLITLEYLQEQMHGPPFSVSADDVRRLYGEHHEILQLAASDILAGEPKLRSRGVTQLHEACYRLIRR